MLADFCLPGADPDLQEPLASRLLRLLEFFGGRVMISSGYRSSAQQQALYDAWEDSGYTVPSIVAKPGTSKHEREPAEAADLHRTDPEDLKWGEVHYTAAAFGLRFPIPSEDWHVELDPAWVEPEPEEWDMTDDDMRKLAGFIADALDARPRSVHSYRDGGQYDVNARTLEEYEFAETQQAALAAQGKDPI